MKQHRSIPAFLMNVRRQLWERLAALSEIEIMTEAERIEEQALSKEFWGWQPVEHQLRPDIQRIPWSEQDTHPLQRRIMWTAHINRSARPDDPWAGEIGMR